MSYERFLRKQADLSTILPAVAGPAIGGFAGRAIGHHFGAENLGAMLGGITGGVTGQMVKETLETKRRAMPQATPPGAPYAVDPTMQDIPPWALSGAQLLNKQASHFSDLIGGDLAGVGWPAYEGIRDKQEPAQIAKNMAGSGLGTLGGGLAGHAVGGLIDKAVGRPVMGPLGVPLSTLIAGLGATIGNFHGNAFAKR